MNVQHATLQVHADIQVTQETAEAFAEAWDVQKSTKTRKYFRLMLEKMVEVGMVVIHQPTTPLLEWQPNQVEWLALQANALYAEATTIPPE